MNDQLDPEALLNTQVYVKNTDKAGIVMGFYLTKERCLVKLNFSYMQTKPCKTCYQMAESMRVDRHHAYVDNCGPQTYLSSENIYIGEYDLKNLSLVPFGGPAAQLIYGK